SQEIARSGSKVHRMDQDRTAQSASRVDGDLEGQVCGPLELLWNHRKRQEPESLRLRNQSHFVQVAQSAQSAAKPQLVGLQSVAQTLPGATAASGGNDNRGPPAARPLGMESQTDESGQTVWGALSSGACVSESFGRARCGKTARRDLCGGRRATGVPTAIPAHGADKILASSCPWHRFNWR